VSALPKNANILSVYIGQKFLLYNTNFGRYLAMAYTNKVYTLNDDEIVERIKKIIKMVLQKTLNWQKRRNCVRILFAIY